MASSARSVSFAVGLTSNNNEPLPVKVQCTNPENGTTSPMDATVATVVAVTMTPRLARRPPWSHTATTAGARPMIHV